MSYLFNLNIYLPFICIFLVTPALFFNQSMVGAQPQKTKIKQHTQVPKMPKASKKDHIIKTHGHIRNDPYYWMRLTDQQKTAQNPDEHTQQVLNYIQQENQYTSDRLKHTQPLQDTLFKEMVGRLQKDQSSVPYSVGGYTYYQRYEAGKEYQIHCRKKDGIEHAKEEIILDENLLAQGHDYFSLGTLQVSPNQKWIAYTTDTVSRRMYTLYFKNLETQETLSESIPHVTGQVAWANDNQTIFYTTKNKTTLLSEKVWRHQLRTAAHTDQVVYTEKDPSFYIGVQRSKSGKWIIIWNESTIVSDYHLLSTNTPNGVFKSFTPRGKDHLYQIHHTGNQFYIISNHQALNSRFMVVSENDTEMNQWKEVIPHRADVHLLEVDSFQEYLVLSERKNGLKTLRVLNFETKEDHYLSFNEEVYSAQLSAQNKDPKSLKVRYIYTSLTQPKTIYEYDLKTKQLDKLKQDRVLGDFDATRYQSKRMIVKARDGQKIPVSLVFRKDMRKTGPQELLLYGYGSYGYTLDPYFTSSRLSLLDRGFIYAIAHVRGGQIYGKASYEDGKLMNKKNTFYDFIDVGKSLIEQKYTTAHQLFAFGGSAGGLLMGAIINEAPQLWKGVVSAVPFVDVVTTMLDETIPLTSNEWNEWGNPKEKEAYEYMLSYSPYDQIKKQKYPHLLVTSGFFDSQVQYWEPLKYVAKLREHWQGDHTLLLHMEMGAGHGGQSGRYRRYKETARIYAFILDLAFPQK